MAGDVIFLASYIDRDKHVGFLPGLVGESQLGEVLILGQMGVDGVFAPFGSGQRVLSRENAVRTGTLLTQLQCFY